jgi:hypothetical protein
MNNTPGDLRPQERTDAPEDKPSGELGGHPINADETAPREHVPDAGGAGAGGNRNPDAVDDEPGSDL